jgi:hypothetical protein
MSKSKIKRWTVSGKIYDKKTGGSTEQTITFEENSPLNASIPVNAPLAVSLMKQLIELIPPDVLYPISGKSISQQLRDLFPPPAAGVGGDEKSDISQSLQMKIAVIANKIQELENLADLLLRNSLAITADKGTLMKALSQPDCEGLRFYQCVSGDSTAEPKKLSLVILAVDRESSDLGYEFEPSIKKDIDKIGTKSFSAEYNKTSGPLDFFHLDDTNLELKPYALLKYALNATNHPNPPTVP